VIAPTPAFIDAGAAGIPKFYDYYLKNTF